MKIPEGRSGLWRAALLWAVVFGVSPLAAQELALQRDFPGLGAYRCPVPVAYVPPELYDRAQAQQLGSDATQAVILGELLRAQELLQRATELDPAAPELAYNHARVLEDLRLVDEAMAEYCRVMTLVGGESGNLDPQARIDALYDAARAAVPEAARGAFLAGLAEADLQAYESAAQSFSSALEELPDLAPAVFNRALVLEQLGRIRESVADYRRYLDLVPSEVDPVVTLVAERIGALEELINQPTPSPRNALALGIVFPGMGQYYSGRRLGGTVVLAASATALAAGLMYKKVTISCLTPVGSGQDCPAGQIVDESSRRPYMGSALGVAGAVMVAAAVEAFIRARGRRAEADGLVGEASTQALRITGPSVTTTAGRLQVKLVGLAVR